MIELPFASPSFVHWLAALLLLSRLGDVVSTYLFTPTLKLEGNAIARRLGWPFAWLSLALALLPYYSPALGVAALTASLFVTGSNLTRGWFARALGEDEYHALVLRALARTSLQTVLAFVWGGAAFVGLAGVLLATWSETFEWGYWFGIGIILYALAIAIHGASFYLRLFRLTQSSATPAA
jgi:hypothetical protein